MNADVLKRLERLAELKIPESAREKTLRELERMVAYVSTLEELDLEGVEPLYQVTEQGSNVFREDEVVCFEDREALLSNAPMRRGELFAVPKTFS